MRPKILNYGAGIAIITILLISFSGKSAAASEKIVQLTVMAAEYGGDCSEWTHDLLVGSNFRVSVQYVRDESTAEVIDGKYPGYQLEAALDLNSGETFTAISELSDRLQPRPYLTSLAKAYKTALEQGESAVERWTLSNRQYILSIPEEFVGHTLFLRAVYTGTGSRKESNIAGPFQIIAPCSEEDEARVLSSMIYSAYFSGNFDVAVALADSMIYQGMTNATGWYHALLSARNLQRYDKQLEYFDNLFNDYGVTTVSSNVTNPLKKITDGSYDYDELQLYNVRREKILEAIENSEQQR